MHAVSVVIITKNEAEYIVDAVRSATKISDDIIIADSGSTDKTKEIAALNGARVVEIEWKGFGAVRNEAAQHAKHDWVFALDADERIDETLADSIQQLINDNASVYGFKRLNYLYGKPVKHGEWGRDVQYRLYNKQVIQWKEVPVHESLDVAEANKKILPGVLLHLTMKNKEEYEAKTLRYAKLMAEKYLAAGKSGAYTKQFFSPVVNFVTNYFFRLGFLDGKSGITVAAMSAKYSFLKYKFLRQLQHSTKFER